MLIAQAVFNKADDANRLNREDAEMFMSCAHFMSTVSRMQREHFAHVMQLSLKSTLRQFMGGEKSYGRAFKSGGDDVEIPVPSTKQLIRSWIMEGKYALFSNLPHPTVHTLLDHAYLLPSECVAYLLAHGSLVGGKKVKNYQTLGQSPLAKDIIKVNNYPNDGCLTVFVSLWSDDFEPNCTKQGRGGVWIMTMTIETADSGHTTIHNTYPLAVGPKGTDHHPVSRIILNNLKSIRRKEDGPPPTVM